MTLEDFANWLRGTPETALFPVRWAIEVEGCAPKRGTWCEFGVADGGQLSYLAQHRGEATVWGFDSFRGLPEAWNAEHGQGRFKQDHPPMPPEGVNLLVGWFKDTLPCFTTVKPVTFAYVDCDLYSSALTVLRWMVEGAELDEAGAVVVFDDMLTPPLDNGVMRALYECREYLDIERLVRNGDNVALRMTVKHD